MVIRRLSRPDERLKMIGALAILSCALLVASLLRPRYRCFLCCSCWLAGVAPIN